MALQSLHCSPAVRRWFGVFVVLAFGLKALIPTGFMLAAVEGRARLVMCPAGLYEAAANHHVHHGLGMDHPSGLDHAAHAAHAALAAHQCPFALAGSAGLLAAVQDPAKPYFVPLPPRRVVAVFSVPATPPLRQFAPRGPPALA